MVNLLKDLGESINAVYTILSAQTISWLSALKYNIEILNFCDLPTLTDKAALQLKAHLKIWPVKT